MHATLSLCQICKLSRRPRTISQWHMSIAYDSYAQKQYTRCVGVLHLFSLVLHLFDWVVVQWWPNKQTTQRRVLTRDWIVSSNRLIYSALNGEHTREDLNIQSRTQQTYTSNNRNQTRDTSRFQPGFCLCFIVDLLVQHNLHHTNLANKNWRTWKTNQITSACLTRIWIPHNSNLCTSSILIHPGPLRKRARGGDSVVARTLDSHLKAPPPTWSAKTCIMPTSWRWAWCRFLQIMKHHS